VKRFYKTVTVQHTEENAFTVMLDGRPVKTPSGRLLLTPGENLALALKGEWDSQNAAIDPQSMPLTQFLNTAIDRVAPDRAGFESGVMVYLDTDLLCYRAARPADLAQRQEALWNPPLDWFREQTGCALETTTGLTALRQPLEAKRAANTMLSAASIEELTALQITTAATGSLILALALCANAISPAQAFQAALAEELYKAEIYNESLHGLAPQEEQRQHNLHLELETASRFISLIKE
jgi:chaperone required for assembly of F1-ATPase